MPKKREKEDISLDEKINKMLVPKEEEPYEIPNNWVWTRLGEVVNILNGDRGKNYPSKDKLFDKGEIPFISAVNLESGKIFSDKLLYLSEEQYNKLRAGKLQKGDLLFCLRGSLGKFGKNYFEKGAIASSLAILRDKTEEKLLNNYIEKYLFSPLLNKEILKYNNGTAQPNLSAENFKKFLIPLPPLEEQKRIVDKLDSFFDKIQKVKDIIQDVKEKNTLRKESILSKAFSGELTAKWRVDNFYDAKELLDKINEEKLSNWELECKKAEEDGRKKPSKPKLKSIEEMQIPNDEIPYQIPDNWVWTRLGDITEVASGGTPSTSVNEYYENGDIAWLSPKDLSGYTSKYISRGAKNITKKGLEKSSAVLLPKNTVLMSSRAPIGYVAISTGKISTNQGFKNFLPSMSYVPEFLYYYLIKSKSYLEDIATGTTFKELSGEKAKKIIFPLPPLEEQKEIVKILDNIFSKENTISELISLEDKIQVLEKSILDKAFRGELGTHSPNDTDAHEILKNL